MTRTAGSSGVERRDFKMEVDLKRLMDPKTAVAKAREALSAEAQVPPDAASVSALASAIMVREGLVAVAKVLAEGRVDDG